MKILCLLSMALILLLCASCSDSPIKNVRKELGESISNISDSDNKYVQMVKNGYMTDSPDLTYDNAFSAFFETPRWKYFRDSDDLDIVEFTGDCTFRDVAVKARIRFAVDEDKGTFEAVYLSFNEVPQDAFTLAALITTVFDHEEEPEPDPEPERKPITEPLSKPASKPVSEPEPVSTQTPALDTEDPRASNTGSSTTPTDNLLTADEARQIYNAWLSGHADMSSYILDRQSYETYELYGERYYLFHADDMVKYWYNILVNMKTGEMLLMMTTDGKYPTTTYEPLDDWYNSNQITNQVLSDIRINDYTLPPDQYVGDIFGVRGVIESNYIIRMVTVAVYNDRGVAETSSIAYPYAYTYDIRNLDYDLLFDRLTAGLKTYEIEVTNEMETKWLTHSFWVFSR